MGIAIPQLAPASEDRTSGAQVIDGSLKFDSSKKTVLHRTFQQVTPEPGHSRCGLENKIMIVIF